MTEKKENIHDLYKTRAVVLFVIVVTGSLLFLLMMNMHLISASRDSQIQENERFFSTTIPNFDSNNHEIQSLIDRFNRNNTIMLDNLIKTYSYDNYDKLKAMPGKEQSEMLMKATSSMLYCNWILILDRDGHVYMADLVENVGINIFDDVNINLTRDQFHELCDGKEEKTTVDNPYIDEGVPASKIYIYCRPIPGSETDGEQKYIMLSFTSDIIDEAEARMKDISAWMNESSIGNNGAVFMVDASSDTVRYGSFFGKDMKGIKASEAGLDAAVLSDGYNGTAVIDGTECFISTRAYSSKLYGIDTYIVAVMPESEMRTVNAPVAIWTFCLFLIFTILIIAYSSCLRSGLISEGADLKKIRIFGRGNANVYLCGTFAGKIIPVVLFATILIFLSVFYFQILIKLSESFSESVMIEKDISQNVEESAKLQKEFQEYSDLQYESRAKLMSLMVALDSDIYLDPNREKDSIRLFDDNDSNGKRDAVKDEFNNEIQVINNSGSLQKLKESNQVDEIYLISDTGTTMATSSAFWNFSLSYDSTEHTYEFWDIIYGKRETVIQKEITNEEGKVSQYIGSPLNYYTCRDEDGSTRFVGYTEYLENEKKGSNGIEMIRHTGLLLIELGSDEDGVIDSARPEYILANNRISSDGFLMGFVYDEEKEDYKLIYSPEPDMKDKYASELGITKAAFSGDYNGFQTIGKERYLQSFRQAADYFVATAVPIRSLYSACVRTSVFCSAFTLAIMLIITICMIFLSDLGLKVHDTAVTGAFAVPVRNSSTGKWGFKNHSWKFETILRNGMIVLVIVFLYTVITEGSRYGSDSAFYYILGAEWERGVHIFSLSACCLIIIVSIIGMKMLGYVICQIATVFGNRAVTMIRPLVSLLKVIAIAGIMMYCLFLLGIDATSLIASAGILSLVVGMGAQSLVGDLLAGVFIIMDGSLHVGDYVTIDNVRGKVLEIGLRTTKFEDDNQNIRVICNNQIKAFANMSKKYSLVYYNIPVPYNEDYPRIKKILNEEFLKIYEEHRFLKGIPSCLGIENFGSSSVDLRVRFMCEESERFTVMRFMHDEIMRIFNENNITIPFNQLDVHIEKELVPVKREDKDDK